jgi:hypothetical protein
MPSQYLLIATTLAASEATKLTLADHWVRKKALMPRATISTKTATCMTNAAVPSTSACPLERIVLTALVRADLALETGELSL